MIEKILQVKNLTISFRTGAGKVQAVRDISFDLMKGETLAIVGESGSGKSVTSKAILGISAANALIENGEILYAGKDLLQISEEDFHKIRGDKIGMVFQDPLSALNPIMRTGKQLTEAMLLNNKADRKDARKRLKQMQKTLSDQLSKSHAGADPQASVKNKALIDLFENIQEAQIRLELAYGEAREHAEEARRLAVTTAQDISKHVHSKVNANVKSLKKNLNAARNQHLFPGPQVDEYIGYLTSFEKDRFHAQLSDNLMKTDEGLQLALAQPQPDFYLLAKNMVLSKKDNINSLLAPGQDFDDALLSAVAQALQTAQASADVERVKAISVLEQQAGALDDKPLDINKAKHAIELMSKAVEKAIDPLSISRESQLYSFRFGVSNALQRYRDSLTQNKKELKRYNKSKAKHDRLEKRGKGDVWKVVPLNRADPEGLQTTLQRMVERMRDELINEKPIADYTARAHNFLNFSRSLASRAAYRISPAMAKERAISLMREVGIPEPELRFTQYPFELSGGMRQRIVIAIALSANPDILICDEPTTALDVTIQAQILELINSIKEQRGLSIIFITHDLGVVANMADRIAVMYAGKIVELGTADEVFYEPAHPYTWALLSSMPDIDTKEKLSAIPGTPPNMTMPPEGDAFAARNQYAMQIDFEQQPPLFKITDSHYAATWLLHPNAPKVEPPAIVTDRIQRMKKREGVSK